MAFWVSLKRGFATFLVGLVCCMGLLFSLGGTRAAIALPLNPTLAAYQSDQLNYSPSKPENQDSLNRSQTGIQGALDNVRDKLNLDQPIHPDTKEFFNDVKERITGEEEAKETAKNTTNRMAGDRN